MPRDTSQPITRDLYLSNLAPTLSEADILKLFRPHGEITSLTLVYTSTPRIAFVSYSTVEQARKAVEKLQGCLAHAYTMRIAPAKGGPRVKGKRNDLAKKSTSTQSQIDKIQAKLEGIRKARGDAVEDGEGNDLHTAGEKEKKTETVVVLPESFPAKPSAEVQKGGQLLSEKT